MPVVLNWSGLFMFHHEFADEKKRPTTEESLLPEAHCTCFSQGRLYRRLCQVVGEPAVQKPEYCSELLGIEKWKDAMLLFQVDPSRLIFGPIV